jgi:hypothetical protein
VDPLGQQEERAQAEILQVLGERGGGPGDHRAARTRVLCGEGLESAARGHLGSMSLARCRPRRACGNAARKAEDGSAPLKSSIAPLVGEVIEGRKIGRTDAVGHSQTRWIGPHQGLQESGGAHGVRP